MSDINVNLDELRVPSIILVNIERRQLAGRPLRKRKATYKKKIHEKTSSYCKILQQFKKTANKKILQGTKHAEEESVSKTYQGLEKPEDSCAEEQECNLKIQEKTSNHSKILQQFKTAVNNKITHETKHGGEESVSKTYQGIEKPENSRAKEQECNLKIQEKTSSYSKILQQFKTVANNKITQETKPGEEESVSKTYQGIEKPENSRADEQECNLKTSIKTSQNTRFQTVDQIKYELHRLYYLWINIYFLGKNLCDYKKTSPINSKIKSCFSPNLSIPLLENEVSSINKPFSESERISNSSIEPNESTNNSKTSDSVSIPEDLEKKSAKQLLEDQSLKTKHVSKPPSIAHESNVKIVILPIRILWDEIHNGAQVKHSETKYDQDESKRVYGSDETASTSVNYSKTSDDVYIPGNLVKKSAKQVVEEKSLKTKHVTESPSIAHASSVKIVELPIRILGDGIHDGSQVKHSKTKCDKDESRVYSSDDTASLFQTLKYYKLLPDYKLLHNTKLL